MNDGELKKRGIKRLMLLYKNTKQPVFMNLARNHEADVDEAKKDLLDHTPCSAILDLGPNYLLIEKETFEKWFGGSS